MRFVLRGMRREIAERASVPIVVRIGGHGCVRAIPRRCIQRVEIFVRCTVNGLHFDGDGVAHCIFNIATRGKEWSRDGNAVVVSVVENKDVV